MQRSLSTWQRVLIVVAALVLLAATKQTVSAAGGRLIFFYMTFGQYDFAALTEMPDDEVAARLVLSINAQGNIRTETVRAFTEEEAIALVSSLGG